MNAIGKGFMSSLTLGMQTRTIQFATHAYHIPSTTSYWLAAQNPELSFKVATRQFTGHEKEDQEIIDCMEFILHSDLTGKRKEVFQHLAMSSFNPNLSEKCRDELSAMAKAWSYTLDLFLFSSEWTPPGSEKKANIE